MLATKFQERSHDIVFPAFCQPKLDGVRCTLFKNQLFSRKNKVFSFMNHILDLYKDIPSNIVLDGELYSDYLTFQEIISIVKQKNNAPPKDISNKIKYYVFDLYDTKNLKMDFQDRLELLKKIVHPRNQVETKICKSKENVLRLFEEYNSKGYEGVMIRNFLGVYEFNKRSKNLQKLKPFQDSEYKIIGYTQGTGTEAGCVIWECQSIGGNFNVRPKGTREERKELFKKGKEFIGKWITIKYQELTDTGIPRFPTTLQDSYIGYIRDYE